MALKWAEVTDKPEFLSLSPLEKDMAQAQYFNEVVMPQVPQQDWGIAEKQFYSDFPSPIMQKAQGIGNVISPSTTPNVDLQKQTGVSTLNYTGKKYSTPETPEMVAQAWENLLQPVSKSIGMGEKEPFIVKDSDTAQGYYDNYLRGLANTAKGMVDIIPMLAQIPIGIAKNVFFEPIGKLVEGKGKEIDTSLKGNPLSKEIIGFADWIKTSFMPTTKPDGTDDWTPVLQNIFQNPEQYALAYDMGKGAIKKGIALREKAINKHVEGWIPDKALKTPEPIKSPAEQTIEAEQAKMREAEAQGLNREQQLEKTQVNAIKTGEAADILLKGKSLRSHIKEGIESGLKPEVLENNIRELLNIQYAKEPNPINKIKVLEAQKQLNKDVSGAFEEVISSEGKGQKGYAKDAEGQMQDVVSPQEPSVPSEAQKQAALSPLSKQAFISKIKGKAILPSRNDMVRQYISNKNLGSDTDVQKLQGLIDTNNELRGILTDYTPEKGVKAVKIIDDAIEKSTKPAIIKEEKPFAPEGYTYKDETLTKSASPATKQLDKADRLEQAAEKLSQAAEKLTDTFLKVQEASKKTTTATQLDLAGAKTGLEGKLPSGEIKGQTALEKATEDAKTREAQKGQIPIPEQPTKKIRTDLLPKDWGMEIGVTKSIEEGGMHESTARWDLKKIVFNDKKSMENPNIVNHEIAHVIIGNEIYGKGNKGLMEAYNEIKTPEWSKGENTPEWIIKNGFNHEEIAMDYGKYLTDNNSVSPVLQALFGKIAGAQKGQGELLKEQPKFKPRELHTYKVGDVVEISGKKLEIKKIIKDSFGEPQRVSVQPVEKVTKTIKDKTFDMPQKAYDISPFTEIESQKGIVSELKGRVDEAVGDVVIPVGMSIKTVGGKNLKDAINFKFENSETEARWKKSQEMPKESLRDKGRETLMGLWNKMSRGSYEHLPRTREFSQLRFDLLKLAKQKGVSTDKALRNIQGITINFKIPDRNLFDRKIILEDFKETAKEGKELPFNFTLESVEKELGRIDTEIAKHPEIQRAVQLRNKLSDTIREDYVSAMKDIGFDVSEKINRKNYFRHQVLDYVQAKGLFGTGQKLKTPANRGFLRERKGSSLDINTDYIKAESEVMSQMLYDIEVAKLIKKIDNDYSITEKVKADAKSKKLTDWHEAIPDGYVAWQPREGNTFYMADTVPAKIAEALTEGKLAEIGIDASTLGKALARGHKYKEFVVKKEIADTLDSLIRNKEQSRVMDIDKKLLKGWKVWQLISPRRFFKYNIRNLTGDADGVFLGNPSGFSKTPQAFKELYATFYGDKSMTPEMQAWFERGGMESTLQAQEMGTINKLKMFQEQYETKTGIKDIPINVWNKYWKSVRLTTDFREAILRYANYLDYVEQMKANPQGKPKNYGASMREEISGLSDIKDKAFKLSNELLGAYDDISVIGEGLRKHVYPFWSWKEINMRRYYRVYKNAIQDGKLAETTGNHLLKGIAATPYTAYKIGKFAVGATAFWSALQVWNHTMFPNEEGELSEDKKSRPHIILGRDKDGKIISFDRIGALGDFLEWFGLDASPKYVDNFLKGKMTLKEIAIDMAKSPVNVVVQGLSPYFKTPAELLSQKQFFPDFSKPRTIRDNGLYLASSLGLANEYKALAKLPSRPYLESLNDLFVYKTDPYQEAYGEIANEKRRFLKKIGKGGEGSFITPRGDALYNFKLALRYDDKKAAMNAIMEYAKLGGTRDGLQKSLDNLSPLAGLNKDEFTVFVSQLNEDDRKKLVKALIFYDRVLLGKATND